jgi:hypothetical protein
VHSLVNRRYDRRRARPKHLQERLVLLGIDEIGHDEFTFRDLELLGQTGDGGFAPGVGLGELQDAEVVSGDQQGMGTETVCCAICGGEVNIGVEVQAAQGS